ncbi:MAG: Hsp20/alpha crystallin family protein [Spirochaetia bacterium]|jgi:HSP20 family protein|nr:Hsp20/alpha crystallin family protein [Spirochaetia bacterium]
MALIKWKNKDLYDPWEDIRNLQDEINDLFNIEKRQGYTGLFDRNFSPAVDVVESENDYSVICELPGIDSKDIDLSITSNVLTIKGTKKSESEDKNGKYYKKESWTGSFQRTLPLPAAVNGEMIKADLKDGVLTVILPKKEEAKPRSIAVKVR